MCACSDVGSCEVPPLGLEGVSFVVVVVVVAGSVHVFVFWGLPTELGKKPVYVL